MNKINVTPLYYVIKVYYERKENFTNSPNKDLLTKIPSCRPLHVMIVKYQFWGLFNIGLIKIRNLYLKQEKKYFQIG